VQREILTRLKNIADRVNNKLKLLRILLTLAVDVLKLKYSTLSLIGRLHRS